MTLNRRRALPFLPVFVAMGFLFSLLTTFAKDVVKLDKGDKAPDFTLVGTDGKSVTLSDYWDKEVVVLAWFPKAGTPA